MPTDPAETLITLATYRDLYEAMLAKGKLNSAGLSAFLADDNTVRMDWLWSSAIGGVRLQVLEADADEAWELLAAGIPESLEVEPEQVYQQPRCPKCGSIDVGHDSPKMASD